MKNMNLNVGGLIGALLTIGGVLAYCFLATTEVPSRIGKLVVAAAVGGGVLGNWLWSLAFPPAEPPDSSQMNPGR